MTNKQFTFIEGLLKKKEYDLTNSLIQAFNSGYDLSSKDASTIIDYLLKCEDKKAKAEEKEITTKFEVGEKVKIEDDFGKEMIVEIKGIEVSKDYRGKTHVKYQIFLEEYNEEVSFYEDEIEKM